MFVSVKSKTEKYPFLCNPDFYFSCVKVGDLVFLITQEPNIELRHQMREKIENKMRYDDFIVCSKSRKNF